MSAPAQSRRLSSQQLRGLLLERGTHPSLQRLAAEVGARQLERLRHAAGRQPGLDALMQLACYELPEAMPRVTLVRLPDEPVSYAPQKLNWPVADQPRLPPPPEPVYEPAQAGQAATLRAAAQTASLFCAICSCQSKDSHAATSAG
jgi:hypothetical protein